MDGGECGGGFLFCRGEKKSLRGEVVTDEVCNRTIFHSSSAAVAVLLPPQEKAGVEGYKQFRQPRVCLRSVHVHHVMQKQFLQISRLLAKLVITPHDAETIFANFMATCETCNFATRCRNDFCKLYGCLQNIQFRPRPRGLAPNPHVCREVACPLGTASETAREGQRMFSARAISDIVRI